jgi:hypothetical protein
VLARLDPAVEGTRATSWPLDGLSFAFEAGTIFGLLGPNGPHGISRRITSCRQWHDALAQARYE